MKLFVAVALLGHLELASCAENSKDMQSYETYPLKDEEQALLCSQPREKCP